MHRSDQGLQCIFNQKQAGLAPKKLSFIGKIVISFIYFPQCLTLIPVFRRTASVVGCLRPALHAALPPITGLQHLVVPANCHLLVPMHDTVTIADHSSWATEYPGIADDTFLHRGFEMVKEFAFINLFRAAAAFWVVTAHCMIWGGWHGLPLPSPKIAVDLFMMISGYLMAANASARSHFEPLTSPRNWLRFWLRRFFRLAPAYYLSLALAILSSQHFLSGYQELQNLNPSQWSPGGVYDPSLVRYTLNNIFLHLSFLFGLHPTYSCSTFLPDWSLSLEMQFYFAFPLIFIVMQKFGFIRSSIFIGLPVFFFGYEVSRQIHFLEPSLLIFKLNYFLVGIILYRFLSVDTNSFKRLALALSAILLVSINLQSRAEILVTPSLLLSMLTFGWLEASNHTPWLISLFINNRIIRFPLIRLMASIYFMVFLFRHPA